MRNIKWLKGLCDRVSKAELTPTIFVDRRDGGAPIPSRLATKFFIRLIFVFIIAVTGKSFYT